RAAAPLCAGQIVLERDRQPLRQELVELDEPAVQLAERCRTTMFDIPASPAQPVAERRVARQCRDGLERPVLDDVRDRVEQPVRGRARYRRAGGITHLDVRRRQVLLDVGYDLSVGYADDDLVRCELAAEPGEVARDLGRLIRRMTDDRELLVTQRDISVDPRARDDAAELVKAVGLGFRRVHENSNGVRACAEQKPNYAAEDLWHLGDAEQPQVLVARDGVARDGPDALEIAVGALEALGARCIPFLQAGERAPAVRVVVEQRRVAAFRDVGEGATRRADGLVQPADGPREVEPAADVGVMRRVREEEVEVLARCGPELLEPEADAGALVQKWRGRRIQVFRQRAERGDPGRHEPEPTAVGLLDEQLLQTTGGTGAGKRDQRVAEVQAAGVRVTIGQNGYG